MKRGLLGYPNALSSPPSLPLPMSTSDCMPLDRLPFGFPADLSYYSHKCLCANFKGKYQFTLIVCS